MVTLLISRLRDPTSKAMTIELLRVRIREQDFIHNKKEIT